ncbi:conserved hypothetical protein [Xenorhabdus nematophila str. Websteri]|nr:conserved hypothetical protein [Xenorhabdus nematophila str. Websteri]
MVYVFPVSTGINRSLILDLTSSYRVPRKYGDKPEGIIPITHDDQCSP